jgi:hypothetical protein
MLEPQKISRRGVILGVIAAAQSLGSGAWFRSPFSTRLQAQSSIASADYVERVYSGVLGKLIGVLLARPVEGWGYRTIVDELGEIRYYINGRMKRPLLVTDDDISGTFTFLRALADYD